MYAIRIISPGLYTAHQAKNIPNIILNSLVDTLNSKAKIPHTMILVINDAKFWNHGDFLLYQMERIIARFLKEIRRIIEARNLSLPPKAVNWDYPRIFLTRALPLPNNMTKPYPKGFKPNRRRYNKLILRGEVQHNYRSINLPDFTCGNENKFFSKDGSITQKGYQYLWIAISDAIHKADNQDRITLNKIRAKQLAAQINISNKEMKEIHGGMDDVSDAETLAEKLQDDAEPVPPVQHRDRPAKRALIDDFNNCTTITQVDSPGSSISAYYTAKHKHSGEPRFRYKQHPGFKPKKKKANNFYKNKQWY